MPEQQKPNPTQPATQKPAAQTPNPQQKPVQQPQPVDNDHVAEGAQKFDSKDSKEAAPVDAKPSLEERVTELEKVVHTIAPYSRAAEHGVVTSWLKKVGARIEKLL